MATSNSTDFALNTAGLIDSALRLARILGIGQSVNAQIYNIARENLNIMIRHWENTGVRLWALEKAILFPGFEQILHNVPLSTSGEPQAFACLESDYKQNTLDGDYVAGSSSIDLVDTPQCVENDYIGIASDEHGLMWLKVLGVAGNTITFQQFNTDTPTSTPYSASDGAIVVSFTTLVWQPLRIIEARRRDLTADTEIPLRIVGKFEYERIPNKSTASIPLWLYQQPRISYTDLYVWPPTSYSNWAICYTFERRYQDFDSSVNDPDFPPEAYEAIRHGLAARMGRELAINGERQAYLDALAEQYFNVMRNRHAGSASIIFGARH